MQKNVPIQISPRIRVAEMLDEISGVYSSLLGGADGQANHPVVFLPSGNSKPCRQTGQMSSMAYLAFVIAVLNAVINAANNINNNNVNILLIVQLNT